MGIATTGVEGGGAQISPEIAAIVEGGENFVARLVALQKAKQENETALANFKLGQAAKAAYDDAAAKQAAANQAVIDAQAQAQSIVNDAQALALDITSKAKAQADSLISQATDTKNNADAAAADKIASAQAQLDAANSGRQEVDDLRSQLKAALADAKKAKADSDAATAAAKALSDDFNKKLAIIQGVSRSLTE